MHLRTPTFTLRSFFFYASLLTAVFWFGWSGHEVANDLAVAKREKALRQIGEERLAAAQLKDLCQVLERLPGITKVAVNQGHLNRSNPLDSKLVIAVTPANPFLDQTLTEKIKSICKARFANVPQEAISVIDSSVLSFDQTKP